MSTKCDYCNKDLVFLKYNLKAKNEFLCTSCFNIITKLKLNIATATVEEMKQIIQQKTDEVKARRETSSTGIVTSKDMYYYARENGFGRGMNEEWGIKHFKVIALNLLEGEDVLMTFIGMHNYTGATKHGGYSAYAITNKRFIIGQKNVIAGETLQTVYLDNINDITFSSGVVFGIMTVDTIREQFNVALDKTSAKNITTKAHEILDDIRAKNKALNSTHAVTAVSSADEILKFKQLMDAGIITEEEFQQKKQQLLGF